MKMLIVLFLFMSSCTTPTTNPTDPIKTVGCSIESSLALGLSQTFAATMSCTNVAQIQSDILSTLGSVNLCAAKPQGQVKAQGIIGDIVCPSVVGSVMALVSTKIPVTWGCKLNSSSALTVALTKTCSSLVGI